MYQGIIEQCGITQPELVVTAHVAALGSIFVILRRYWSAPLYPGSLGIFSSRPCQCHDLVQGNLW